MSTYNPYETRSIVELFRYVGYMNDGMREYNSSLCPYGWRPSTITFSSDGDVASIQSAVECTIWAEIPSSIKSEDYPTVYCRGRITETDSYFKVGVKDSEGNEYFSDKIESTVYVTSSLNIPPGRQYSSIGLVVYKFVDVDYVAIGRGLHSLSPHNMVINRNLSEELSSAEIEMSYVEPSTIVESRHFRGDTVTVNSVESYYLGTLQSTITCEYSDTVDDSVPVYWSVRLWKVSVDGSSIEIGNEGEYKAIVSRDVDGEGIQTASLSVPSILLDPLDSLKVVVYQRMGTLSWIGAATFTTEFLDSYKIPSSTWTVHYYTARECPDTITTGRFKWGASSIDSRIESFTYIEHPIEKVGSHVKIWLAKDTLGGSQYYKVFTGIVDSISKAIKGHEPRNVTLIASDYGQYLKRRLVKHGKSYSGSLHEVVKGIIEPLINSGEITAYNVEESLTDIVRKKVSSNMVMSELLEELAESYDCEYYVDFGQDLHFFKKGSRTSTLNINVDETQVFPYEEDISAVINYQEVIGADNKVLGLSDLGTELWTESLEGWSCPSGASLSLSTIVYSDKFGSSKSIKCSLSTSGGLWVAKDVGTLDLSLGGVLCYAFQYRAVVPISDKAPKLKVRNYFIGPNGTFYIDVEPSGGFISERALNKYDEQYYPEYIGGYQFYYYPLSEIEVPFNYKMSPAQAVNTIGAPSWNEINTIKIEIISPTTEQDGVLWVDIMRIEEVYRSATVSSQESIKKYGLREGVPIGPDPSLDDDSKCELMASIIVAAYKDPVRQISDVEVVTGLNYELGAEYTLSVREMESVPVILRNIRHEVEGLDMHTYLTFSKRYIPDPKRLFAITKRQLEAYRWDIEAWKRAKLPSGVIPTRSERLDFWETAIDFSALVFTNTRKLLALGESDAGWEVSGGCIMKVGLMELYTPDNPEYPATIMASTVRISDKLVENTLLVASAKIKVSGSSFDMARYYIGDLTDSFGYRFDTIGVGSNEVRVLGQTRVNGNVSSIVLDTINRDEFHYYELVYDKPHGTVYFYIDKELKGYLTSLPTVSSLAPFYADVYGWDESSQYTSTLTFKGWELAEAW